jgi:hypothetical protein
MANLDGLKQLTMELAEEIHYDEHGSVFKLVCMIFDSITSYVTIMDTECKLIYINPSAVKACKDILHINVQPGDNCRKIIGTIDPSYCKKCMAKICMNQKKVFNEIFTSRKTTKKYWRTCIPLAYNGVSGTIEILEKYNG